MNVKRITFSIVLSLFVSSLVFAQDDLLDVLDEERGETTNYVQAIFKGQRLINGHTVVTRKKDELEFIISHRFGRVNTGINQFFGLDNANVRFSLEYGLNDRFTTGLGRNSFQKVYDGFLKYSLLRQSTGLKNMPVAVTLFSSMAIRTQEELQFDDDDFNSKISTTHQVLIARKFNESVSLQLAPTYVHRNKVFADQKNGIFALDMGGRFKLNKRMAINVEYVYRLTEEISTLYKDSIGVGLEIETGGHVFHLSFTNSRSMVERGFITETTGDFFDGDIHFGFNISRVF